MNVKPSKELLVLLGVTKWCLGIGPEPTMRLHILPSDQPPVTAA